LRKKVYVTRRISEPELLALVKKCDVTIHDKLRAPSRKEILNSIRDKDGILCMLSDKIDAEVMEAAGPRLKVISSLSTGVDHIDVKEATKRGIYVTFTSDVLTEATADLTFALILVLARKIIQGNELVKQKKWRVGWMPNLLLGTDLDGMTLGILGLGKIGSAVARRAKGFNMRVIYHNRQKRENRMETQLNVKYVDLNNLLKQSDFLSIHADLNANSFHLLNTSQFRKMKNTAYIINTSRGQILNERDLAGALNKKMIAGAALDVFEKEPLSNYSSLLTMKNVVTLPHIGSATYQTRSRMSQVAVQNLLNVFDAKAPVFLVNQEIKNLNI
jgi:glyoxylate reductase